MNTATHRKLVKLYKDIITYIDEHDQNRPSIREVADMMGTSSTSVAKYNLNLLQQMGWIKYTPKIARSIQPIKPIAELPDMPDLVVVDNKRRCWCGKPVWLGPRGMNFKLSLCEQHQREEWEKTASHTRQRTPKPTQPAARSVKVLIVDHTRDEIVRAVVPVRESIRMSGVRGGAKRLIDFYRTTGHIVVEIGEDEASA